MTNEAEHAWHVICLTPVKNEAWVLPQFLAAASIWADVIIIADQGSTDGSKEIAARHPKVTLVDNHGSSYHEAYRQQLLLKASRTIPGTHLLVPLDADEFFSPGFMSPDLVARLVAAGPGAQIRTSWLNVRPGLRDGWIGHRRFIAAWYDNGREAGNGAIHCERLPVDTRDPIIEIDGNAAVMHWQYTAVDRLRSKHRWYQAWERLNHPTRNPVDIYRQYHHMDEIQLREITLLPEAWLSWHAVRGADLTAIVDDGFHWWNQELLAWLRQYGAKHFAYEAIWDFDWVAEASRLGLPMLEDFRDPRTSLQRVLHWWLAQSQVGRQRWTALRMEGLVRRLTPIPK